MPGCVHRVLMIDNPHADITSNAKSGYVNLHEAATCLEVVRAWPRHAEFWINRRTDRSLRCIADRTNPALVESNQGRNNQGTTADSKPNPPGLSTSPFSLCYSQPRAVSARTRSAPLARASGLGADCPLDGPPTADNGLALSFKGLAETSPDLMET
eukprot:1376057-Pyramimonas_sp.AAC.1